MGSKKVTLTIDGVDANEKKSSTKIQYINPNISDDVMRTFANKCAAMSTDTHTATTKTTDEDITTAETPKPKLTLDIDSPKLAELAANDTATAAVFAYIPLAYTFQTRPKLMVDICCVDESLGQYAFDPNAPTDRYATAGYINRHGVGAACKFHETEGREFTQLTIDYYFAETETTAATQYRLTITKTAGEATFAQV